MKEAELLDIPSLQMLNQASTQSATDRRRIKTNAADRRSVHCGHWLVAEADDGYVVGHRHAFFFQSMTYRGGNDVASGETSVKANVALKAEERSGGKECGSPCRSR